MIRYAVNRIDMATFAIELRCAIGIQPLGLLWVNRHVTILGADNNVVNRLDVAHNVWIIGEIVVIATNMAKLMNFGGLGKCLRG